MSERVLVVGAGAVGQVFGRHLGLGGAAVTFFVREKYREGVARGFDMYPLNRRKKQRGELVRFTEFEVVSSAAEVAARRFEQIYLTVSSNALLGDWLRELLHAVPGAIVVSLQPGSEDRARVLAAMAGPRPEERLVSGMISLISYAAPLPGETRFAQPGTAYWFPTLGPSPLSGPRSAVDGVLAALKRGKLPAKRHRDVPGSVAFPSAVLMPYLAALELGGWSFASLRDPDHAARAAGAAREAMAVVSQGGAGRAPFGVRQLARPRVLRLVLALARRLVPLPLETYVREHFIKVGDQTRMFLQQYVDAGRRAGLPVAALEGLTRGLLSPARPSPA